MSGPRSNFSHLDFAVRFKLICMLHDGATCEAIAHDPDIVQAYADRGLKLTRSALSRIKQSREYREITTKRLQAAQSREADRLTALLLQEQQATDSIGEQAALELMEAIRGNIHLAEDSREVERLVRCVGTLTNPVKDNKIEHLKQKNQALEEKVLTLTQDIKIRETEWRNREAELLTKIAELEKNNPAVNSSDVAQAMKAKFGV